jgi:hypothetical protein
VISHCVVCYRIFIIHLLQIWPKVTSFDARIPRVCFANVARGKCTIAWNSPRIPPKFSSICRGRRDMSASVHLMRERCPPKDVTFCHICTNKIFFVMLLWPEPKFAYVLYLGGVTNVLSNCNQGCCSLIGFVYCSKKISYNVYNQFFRLFLPTAFFPVKGSRARWGNGRRPILS